MDHEKDQNEMDQLKRIPFWTRKYAQNRTIPVMIGMLINLALFAAIAIPSYFGGIACRAGNKPIFILCICILALATVALIYFCVPKWGGQFIKRLTSRITGAGGNAELKSDKLPIAQHPLRHLVGLLFGLCVISSVLLGFKGYIPLEYMQPVSAIYIVPFLVLLYLWQRPVVSPFMLLWPALYAIHAILILAGAPILFSGNLEFMNMILPVFGYGFISALLGYIYSRYALRKLKHITKIQESGAHGA